MDNLFSLNFISPKIIFFFKTISLVISLFFVVAIIFFILRTTWLRRLIIWDLQEILTFRPHGLKKIAKQWARITNRLETGLEGEYKLAVIEADSMLDDILKRMGYGGETLGDRLKLLTSATLPNIDQVWEVHKIRNNIVHDPDYRLPLDQAKKVLAIYEQAFRDLQAF